MSKLLTPKQESLITEIRNDWLEISQSGKNITISDVEQGVTELYALDGRKKPLILILNDPKQCQYLANIFSNKKGNNISSHINSQIRSQIYSHIDSQKLEWFSQLGALSWRSGYMAEFDYYIKSGLLILNQNENQLLNNQINFLKAGVWDLTIFDNVCIISKTPKTKRRPACACRSRFSKN